MTTNNMNMIDADQSRLNLWILNPNRIKVNDYHFNQIAVFLQQIQEM